MSREMQRLYATDDTFREVADLLFGGGADELVSKLSPEAAHRKKVERQQAQVGLASNAIGLAAGIGGTAAALRDDRFKSGGKLSRKFHRIGEKIPSPISGKGGKTGAALAGGALGLQVANIGGDLVANRVLARSAKKDPVKKSEPGSADVHISSGYLKRKAGEKAYQKTKPLATKAGKGALKALGEVHPKKKVQKNAGFTFEGEFSKVDADKRQVFGWASIVEMNGQPVVDLQGDYIDIDEIEKSAYDYVIKSRKGGEMHRRNDDDTPVHASDMIESFLVTPEKIEKMGLPKSTPIGWWVGYQVNDDEAWNLVKSGKRTGFSIHGRGQRTATEM